MLSRMPIIIGIIAVIVVFIAVCIAMLTRIVKSMFGSTWPGMGKHREERPPSKVLWVGNVPNNMSEEQLWDWFAVAGVQDSRACILSAVGGTLT